MWVWLGAEFFISKKKKEAWPEWLSWLGIVQCTEKLPVGFQVRIYAHTVAQSPVRGMRGAADPCFTLIPMFLFLPFPSSLNKMFFSIKKIFLKMMKDVCFILRVSKIVTIWVIYTWEILLPFYFYSLSFPYMPCLHT